MEDKVKLVCSQCNTVNQFSIERAVSAARCGKCKATLSTGIPIDVDAVTFDRHIKHTTLPILVDFWAPWCGPCNVFAPTLEQFASKRIDDVRCFKLNTEENQGVGVKYGIRSIPTLVLFLSGQELDRVSGVLSVGQLSDWVANRLLES